MSRLPANDPGAARTCAAAADWIADGTRGFRGAAPGNPKPNRAAAGMLYGDLGPVGARRIAGEAPGGQEPDQ